MLDAHSAIIVSCSDTEEGLTRWMGVQPFLSVVLICSRTGEGLTFWMCSAILISGSDLLRH